MVTKARKSSSYELIGILLLVLGVCSNATVGIFVRLIDLGAPTTSFYRFVLATPILLIYFLLFDRPSLALPRSNFRFYLIAGCCFVGGVTCANLSFQYTTLANGELFGNLLPFVVVPLSWFLYKEKISWQFFIALNISFLGILLMMVGKINPTIESFFGDFLAFCVSLLYGIYLLAMAQIRKTKTGGHTMFHCSNIAALILLPYILLFEDQWLPASWDSFLALLALSWISHLVGAGLVVVGLGRVNQSLAAVIIMAQPIVGALYGYFVMGETLATMEIVGITVCSAGVLYAKFTARGISKPEAMVMGKPLKKRRKRVTRKPSRRA